MPQLDIYTYFTQFQWLLVIFTLLFILINGKYIKTFQSFFFSRNYLLNNLSSEKNDSNFKGFDIKVKKENNQKTTTVPVKKWDQIYEKIRSTKKNRIKSNKKKSVKSIDVQSMVAPQKKKSKKKLFLVH
jgi:hypothetical protein